MIALLFLLPWLIGFFIFLFIPILASLILSFTKYNILQPPLFIGFDNYLGLLKDPIFFVSLKVTFLYAFITLPLTVLFGISMALLLHQRLRFMTFYRTCFYLPSIIPLVASSIIWLWIFRGDEGGLLNSFLIKLGVHGPVWFSDPKWALVGLMVMSLWSIGNSVLIYLAGLQNIPISLYEAADIDGIGFFQKLFYITFPMLSPTIFFNFIIGIISVFQYFIPAYIMTGGGPQNATTFFSLYIYQNAFEDFKFGYASSMAWVLFIIVLLLTFIAFSSLSKKIYYHGK